MKKVLYGVLIILLLMVVWYKFIYLPKTTYQTVHLEQKDVKQEIFATGIVDSEIIYQISSNSTGKITNIFVKEGDRVKSGQVLAIIDGVDLKEKIEEDKYNIAKVHSTKASILNKIEEAKAKYTLANTQLKRYEKLHKDAFVSDIEYDNIKLSLVIADASLKALENDKITLDNELNRLDAVSKGTKEKLKNLILLAPSDGILVQKEIEIGDTAVIGKVLFKIVNPKDIWIKGYIDEAISDSLKVGQDATIFLRSKGDETVDGFVKKIDLVSDPITNEREIGVKFKNIPKQFFLNEQAEVMVVTKTFKNTFLSDRKNIVTYENKVGLWLLKENKALFTPIKILTYMANTSTVAVEGNLKIDDVIIIPEENKKELFNGANVNI
ncbi:MAG: efflux RND transporter periplasmic adaptor subunit [Arcobacteraceae bacterium]|nr:efflux RND transporter periplasmic adaptor subunit [Arcobacteraceae bacterium]